MSSSLDSDSDHSGVPMESSVKSPSSPNKEIEMQPDLSEDWKPPSRFYVRLCFTALCYFSVGKPNLEELWQEVREVGWKKRNERFRTLVLCYLCMQRSAILCYFYLMWRPPHTKIVESVSTVHYDTLVRLSLIFSLHGLLYHMLFWRSDTAIELHTNQRMQKLFYLSRRKALTHVSLVRMTTLTAVCSVGFLAGGFIAIILGANLNTSLAAAAVVALFLDAMMWVDDLVALLMGLLAFIVWVGLGMRYVNMTQRQ
ncbi:hypothetical protein DFJ58DRAFT_728818 [Suillus subalutaceus]|uniref:uncharacterized protein n=1 Tax=Suillus subalutaceus TaxID=48586 RepID=UPI001B876516|nr:uncharacterized protein DFJ58DRAFT_728818 [Suillus subalutaceus]KAG1851598.1 hypothetical protein DFJ58DRAFT_728818 [Suillus subalutaceus]